MTKKINPSYRFCLMCEAKATLFDQMGNPWCEEHKQRCELMNWGKDHGWPEIQCTAPEETVNIAKRRYRKYAIGPEYSLWFTACALGSEHFMDALYSTIFGSEEV